jgi:hypothetical protein
MKKNGSILNQVVIHVILVGLIFAIFFMAVADRVNARGVKQQVLEKEIALLIDSAEAGMSFGVRKINIDGFVSGVNIENGRVFVIVDGLNSLRGYPYFSKYSVDIVEEESKFVVRVR